MKCTVFNTWGSEEFKTATDIDLSIDLDRYINIDPDNA